MTDPLGAADVPALPALAGVRTLTVGIPSVPRAGGEDYLLRTLRYMGGACARPGDVDGAPAGANGAGGAGAGNGAVHWFTSLPGFTPSLLEEECLAPGPHPLRLRILAMNNARPGAVQHAVWEAARAAACAPGGAVSAPLTLCAEVAGVGGPHTLHVPAPAPAPAASGSGGVALSSSTRGWPRRMVVFAQNGRPVTHDGEDAGTPNVPGARVRRQTRDVVDLLEAAAALMRVPGAPQGPGNAAGAASAPGSPLSPASPSVLQLYMAAEDDFRLCPAGVESLAYLLALADERFPPAAAAAAGSLAVAPVPPDAEATGAALAAASGWNALRLSFGLNGAIIHGGDAPVLAAYLSQHQARRPPDHLLVEWFAGEKPQSAAQKAGRAHGAFRYNLLEHFGHASSLRSAASPLYAFCFDELNSGVVFEVEAFKPALCPSDDIWPCPQRNSANSNRVTARVPFGALRANAKADSVQKWAIPGAI